eukprot:3119609-Rhodomonas_salina.1
MNYFGPVALEPFLYSTQWSVVRMMKNQVLENVPGAGSALLEVRPNPLMDFGKRLVANPIGVAWYTSRLVGTIMMDIVPAAIAGDAGAALRSVWTNIYDSQGSYAELVLAEGLMACSGLAIMLGMNN